MIGTAEVLEQTRRIIKGIERKYSPYTESVRTRLQDYEFANGGRLRQCFGTEDMKELETFSEFDCDGTIDNPLVNRLDSATVKLRVLHSSMPRDDEEMERALELMAIWSGLANLGYEEKERNTLELVGDFCADYNSMPIKGILSTYLSQIDSK